MKPSIIAMSALFALLLVLSGCETGSASKQSYDLQSEWLQQANKENDSLREEVHQLRTENAKQQEALKRLPEMESTNSAMANLLRINDYLAENKNAVAGQLFTNLWPRKDEVLKTVGVQAQALDFTVEDVSLYKGYLVATTLFLWPNSDGSGNLARIGISMDPDKQFEVSGTVILGQVAVPAKELARAQSQPSTTADASEPKPALEQSASQIQSSASTGSSWLTEKRKDMIIDGTINAAITAFGAWLVHTVVNQ